MSKNSINDHKKYSHRQTIESGLMAVFPTVEAYRSFIVDEQGDIELFIRLASALSLSH